MYLSKSKAEVIADMVLSNRVAVRRDTEHHTSTGEWDMELSMKETVTTYALELALGTATRPDEQIAWLVKAKENGNDTALVALVRLRDLGRYNPTTEEYK